MFVKGTGYRVGGSGGQPGANATSRRGALSRGAAGRGASRGGGWEEESGLDEWGRQRHREVEGHDPCGASAGRQPRTAVVRHRRRRSATWTCAAPDRLHRPRSQATASSLRPGCILGRGFERDVSGPQCSSPLLALVCSMHGRRTRPLPLAVRLASPKKTRRLPQRRCHLSACCELGIYEEGKHGTLHTH